MLKLNKDTLKKIWQWLVMSSADPKKYAATVKFALLGVVPYVMNILTAACGLGLACFGVTSESLNEVINAVVNALEAALSLVSFVGILYGAVRKLWYTFKGENRVVMSWKEQPPQPPIDDDSHEE